MKKYIMLIVTLVMLGGFGYFYISYEDKSYNEGNIIVREESTILKTTTDGRKYFDIKGAVKNPGVYEFIDGDKVIDAINKAGGLSKDAYTDNINLSKVLINEMVIYVYSKKEIETTSISTTTKTTTSVKTTIKVITTINDVGIDAKCCTCDAKIVDNGALVEEDDNGALIDNTKILININTASLEELQKLSGIGLSKAEAIIEYRTSTIFKSIEDIKNVSGIGDALYEKIKDYITV